MQRHVGGALKTPSELQKTPEQGAATSVLTATAPILEGKEGHYFENCNEAEMVSQLPADYHGVAPYALDEKKCRPVVGGINGFTQSKEVNGPPYS